MINLTRRDVGAARHIGNDRARHKTLGDDRPLLILAPAAPTLRAGDHLNSRHRSAASTSASTVICTFAPVLQPDYPPRWRKAALSGWLRSSKRTGPWSGGQAAIDASRVLRRRRYWRAGMERCGCS